MRNALIGYLAVLAVLSAAAVAGDWPQFHGPDRDGRSAETGLARSWPPGGPKVLWTVKVGMGYGGPAVQGGKVYVLDRPDKRRDVLRCFDLKTGGEEWKFAYPAPGEVKHDGSRATPAVDEKFIFTVGHMGHVTAFGKETKKPIWARHILRDYGGPNRPPIWGIAQSALLYEDTVIIAPQSEAAGVVALDKATGKEVWRSKSVGELQYVTPTLAAIDGADTVITLTKAGVTGVDAGTGRILWQYGGYTCRIAVPNVTVLGDGRILATGGYDAGSAMFKVVKTGEKFTVSELWKSDELNSQMNPVLFHKNHLFANSYSNQDKEDGFLCMTLDGKVVWKTGVNPTFQRGHMLFADDMLYIIDGETGSLRLIEPDPAGFKELAKVEGLLAPPEPWAPMALCDGRLIIRDQHQMHCLEVSAKK